MRNLPVHLLCPARTPNNPLITLAIFYFSHILRRGAQQMLRLVETPPAWTFHRFFELKSFFGHAKASCLPRAYSGRHEARVRTAPYRRRRLTLCSKLGATLSGSFGFALSLYARLLVTLSAFDFRKNSGLLYFLFEALERGFDAFAFGYSNL